MKRDVVRSHLAIVVLLVLVPPPASLLAETREPGLALVGRWWTFWAIGVRRFTSGLRQAAKPACTAEVIFHATSAGSHVVVHELGITGREERSAPSPWGRITRAFAALARGGAATRSTVKSRDSARSTSPSPFASPASRTAPVHTAEASFTPTSLASRTAARKNASIPSTSRCASPRTRCTASASSVCAEGDGRRSGHGVLRRRLVRGWRQGLARHGQRG